MRIRIALGAEPGRILRMFIGDGFRPVAGVVVVGLSQAIVAWWRLGILTGAQPAFRLVADSASIFENPDRTIRGRSGNSAINSTRRPPMASM